MFLRQFLIIIIFLRSYKLFWLQFFHLSHNDLVSLAQKRYRLVIRNDGEYILMNLNNVDSVYSNKKIIH